MQALFITIEFAEIPPSTRRLVANVARRLRSVEGLKSTTWTRTRTGYALWQLFDNAERASHYLRGPILAELVKLPDCQDIYIQEFTVADGLTFLPSPAETQAEEQMAVGG